MSILKVFLGSKKNLKESSNYKYKRGKNCEVKKAELNHWGVLLYTPERRKYLEDNKEFFLDLFKEDIS